MRRKSFNYLVLLLLVGGAGLGAAAYLSRSAAQELRRTSSSTPAAAPAAAAPASASARSEEYAPEALAAIRQHREAARLRKIWRAETGEEITFLLGLKEEAFRSQIARAFPQLKVVRQTGKTLRCAAPRELAESFLDQLPEGVAWITDAPPAQLLNAVATGERFLGLAAPLRTEEVAPTLDGRGEIVAVIDTGLSTGQAETLNADLLPSLYGMVVEPALRQPAALPIDTNGHGTHISGSIISRGVTWNETKGSAPGALLFMQRSGTSTALYLAEYDWEHFARSYAVGSRIISCSWARVSSSTASVANDPSTYSYHASAAESVDAFVWNHPETVVLFAVGNSGKDADQDGVIDLNGICSYEAYSKNAIIVGAQESYRPQETTRQSAYSTAGAPINADPIADPATDGCDGMAAFSSRGPLPDGRIVPMVVAPGTCIWSTLSNGAGFMTGSSMATPLAAGSAAVLRQYLRECHGLEAPTAAAVRAGMILCAESLAPGQYGTGEFREIPEESPNPVEGWGALRPGALLTGPETVGFRDRISLETGESETITIPQVSAGAALTVVLSWIDAPKVHETRDRHLKNNYDLSVTGPDGVTVRLQDELNPIERIRIPVTQAGDYTVTVTGTEIVEDGAGNLAAVAWRAVTAQGRVPLPAAEPASGETVTLTVNPPLGARPYLDFPLYPAPGESDWPKGTRVRVFSGPKLPASSNGVTVPLCGWILRKADGTVRQGTEASFDLELDQDMTLQWYTVFPGMRFLLR